MWVDGAEVEVCRRSGRSPWQDGRQSREAAIARRLAAWNNPFRRLQEARWSAGSEPRPRCPSRCLRTRAATSFHRLDLGAASRKCTSAAASVRTTLICLRSRISRSCCLVQTQARAVRTRVILAIRALDGRRRAAGESRDRSLSSDQRIPLSDRSEPLFDPTRLVNGLTGMPDDVELVEGNAGIGQVLRRSP